MGSITVRKRKDESVAYNAQVRIMQKGVTVYQESQTFDRKATSQVWIKRIETEMSVACIGASAIGVSDSLIVKSQAYGALPATFGTPANTTGVNPLITLRYGGIGRLQPIFLAGEMNDRH